MLNEIQKTAICLVILVFGTKVLRSQSTTNIDISGLSIHSNEEAQQLIKNVSHLKKLSSLEISGSIDSALLQKVFADLALSKITDLEVIGYNGNFPFSSLHYLHSLQRMKFISCIEDNYDDMIEAISELPVHALIFNVIEAGIIPPNMALLKNIDSIEISINENCNSISTEMKETSFIVKGKNDRKIKVRVITYEKELSDDDKRELKNSFVVFSPEPAADPREIPFQRKYKHVAPPIKGAVVPAEIYTVPGKEGATLLYEKSGTLISIPPNAFADANGNTISGPVQIDYKEYRNAADVLLSGIPMKVNSKQEQGQMESAGMFEINASVNGKEVFLKKEKKLDISFVPTDTLTNGYNFYAFNSKSGEWENNGKFESKDNLLAKRVEGMNSKVLSDSIEVWRPSQATEIYRSYIKYPHQTFDSTSFAERFTSAEYDYTINQQSERRSVCIGYNEYRRKNNLVSVFRIHKNKQGEILCKLKTYSRCNPEMSAFAGVSWRLSNVSSTAEFRTKILLGKRFSDIRVEQEGENFIIKLKCRGTIVSFNAEPVFTNKKDSVIELRDRGFRKFKLYTKRLKGREKSFARKIKNGSLMYNYYFDAEKYKVTMEAGYIRAYKFMNAEEKAMDKKTWMTAGLDVKKKIPRVEFLYGGNSFYEDRKITFGGIAIGILNAPVGIIRLASLGLFNCDRIYVDPPAPVLFSANLSFRNEQGEKLDVKRMYTLYKRGVIIENNPSQPMSFRKNAKAGFIVITTDNKVSIKKFGKVEDMGEQKNGILILDVTPAPEQITNPAQLKRYVE